MAASGQLVPGADIMARAAPARASMMISAHCDSGCYDGAQIPSSPFGARLMAVMALLTGVYHLGRRRAVELLSDIVGVRVSLGALSAVEERVSCAVQPCVDEVWDRVRAAYVKHTDGISWYQGGITMALWTLAGSGVTVFKILTDKLSESASWPDGGAQLVWS